MELPARKLCPFCHLDDASVIRKNALAVAIYDGFPVSPGYALIIPKRHIASCRQIHFVPCYAGDMPDPRGGVRLIFPNKAAYWK